MKNFQRRHDLKILLLFWGAQWLLPLVSIVLFQRRFGYGPMVISDHLLIVETAFGLLFGGTMALGAVRWLRERRAARYLLPLAWGFLTVAIYFIYLLAWGGRLFNGMNMRFSWVAPYVLHPSVAIQTLAIPAAGFWGTLVGLPVLILAVHLAAARPLAAMQVGWLVRLRRWRHREPVKSRRQAGAVLAGLALCGLAYVVSRTNTEPLVDGQLLGDPIFASLYEEHGILPLAGIGDALAASGRGYVPPKQFQKKNVILIVVDACRADHLGALGYGRDNTPFLQALRDSGHLRVVRSFYSASCCTYGGVLTMLRSQHWFKMTLHGFGLQDVLKRAGYKVHFLLGGDLSNFNNLKSFYGPNLDSFSDGLDQSRHYTLNDDRGMFESFDKLGPYEGTPSFLYLHLMSVHYLGPRLPEYERYTPDTGKWNPVVYGNNYDNGVVQADRNIYEIFKELKRKGYLQNSIVIITGDHGESLGERGQYGHSKNLYNEEVQPPLLIYDPEPVAYQNLEFARQIDVAPTILDRLGLPIPPGWDGRSLLRDDGPRLGYLRFGDKFAVVNHTPERTIKYIYDAVAGAEEVYDETHDPHEQTNIVSTTNAQELSDLRLKILAFAPHNGVKLVSEEGAP